MTAASTYDPPPPGGAQNTKIIARATKEAGVETHVRLVEVDGITFIEIRDFFPDRELYGRGYWWDLGSPALPEVLRGLTKAIRTAMDRYAASEPPEDPDAPRRTRKR